MCNKNEPYDYLTEEDNTQIGRVVQEELSQEGFITFNELVTKLAECRMKEAKGQQK